MVSELSRYVFLLWVKFSIVCDALEKYNNLLSANIISTVGSTVVLPCVVNYPDDRPADYAVEWKREGYLKSVYLSLDPYPPHVHDDYAGRLSLVNNASLHIINVTKNDTGFYECRIIWLNRPDRPTDNGTWISLVIQAPPTFVYTPPLVQYYLPRTTVILYCNATGNPSPDIYWIQDNDIVKNTTTVRVTGNVLVIHKLDASTKGTYQCVAKSEEGQVNHTVNIEIAHGAHFVTYPLNKTVTKGEKVVLECKASGNPNNITYTWYKNDVKIVDIASLRSRAKVTEGGSLIIYPTLEEDSATYTCVLSNGLQGSVAADCYLDIRFKARVSHTDSSQSLPKGMVGIVECFIEANPQVNLVTWTKNDKLIHFGEVDGYSLLKNGSLMIAKVKKRHEGVYTCTPYNVIGTIGTSAEIHVDVKDPPVFLKRPELIYQRLKGEAVKMPCVATGENVTSVLWKRTNGKQLPFNRSAATNESLKISNIIKDDHGEYNCIASNDVATIVASTSLLVLQTTPHAPTNVRVASAVFSATVLWDPAFDGLRGRHLQTYELWYKPTYSEDKDWKAIQVKPHNATSFTVYNLLPNTDYEYTIRANNELGFGMFSPVVVSRSKSYESLGTELPTDAHGSTFIPPILEPAGPQPGRPLDVTATVATAPDGTSGVKIVWKEPNDKTVPIVYYIVEYKEDKMNAHWRQLSPRLLRTQTEYFATNLQFGVRYRFRVFAFTLTSFSEPSAEKFLDIPRKPFQLGRAGKAGLIGGLTFLAVTGVLALIAVRFCSKYAKKDKRKKYSDKRYVLFAANNGKKMSNC